MELYLGGCYQGKLEYVKKVHSDAEYRVIEGEDLARKKEELYKQLKRAEKCILNHFHDWIKRSIEEKESPEEMVVDLIHDFPNLIFICDEVGNGIVPVDSLERDYRERTGRIQVMLAEQAERVERVLCGMGQRLK